MLLWGGGGVRTSPPPPSCPSLISCNLLAPFVSGIHWNKNGAKWTPKDQFPLLDYEFPVHPVCNMSGICKFGACGTQPSLLYLMPCFATGSSNFEVAVLPGKGTKCVLPLCSVTLSRIEVRVVHVSLSKRYWTTDQLFIYFR